jgi:hypothetical protein
VPQLVSLLLVARFLWHGNDSSPLQRKVVRPGRYAKWDSAVPRRGGTNRCSVNASDSVAPTCGKLSLVLNFYWGTSRGNYAVISCAQFAYTWSALWGCFSRYSANEWSQYPRSLPSLIGNRRKERK